MAKVVSKRNGRFFIVALLLMGCGAEPKPKLPPLKTHATYPQHENVAKFIERWKKDSVPAGLLVPKGIERSKFADALALATRVGRAEGKAIYHFNPKRKGSAKEGDLPDLMIWVDESTDKIVDVLAIHATR